MDDKHVDSIDMSPEGLAGRLFGQDILLRRLLFQMSILQVTCRGGDRETMKVQVEMLQKFLEDDLTVLAATQIDGPAQAMKREAMKTIELNYTDIIGALTEYMNG